ncbi:DUF664 domain-containing protein [Kitasatospora nipponensis]|uniref:DUF664 domain-containing protein n=1 Tax=Kitasatospora nipponensis TaxID=258049 RepID=A0ABN1WBX1_9ACTN
MNSAKLLADAFGRIREVVHEAAEGLTAAELSQRLDGDANTVAWLLWHLTRIQDDHLADASGTEQVWMTEGWADRFEASFGTALPPGSTGYGHTSAQVAALRVDSPDLLTGYHDAVHARTTGYLGGLTDRDLDRVVDESWSPPVTLGVRLVSVVSDDLQHAGQAVFIRGVLLRRRR